jgi:glycosyltransferase involved in cell wall biosynthesis
MTVEPLFFLDNSGIENIDLSNVEKGNPGCGGTEFSIVSAVSNLTRAGQPSKLLTTRGGKFPQHIEVVKVDSFYDATKVSSDLSAPLIYRPRTHIKDHLELGNIHPGAMLVPWLHITPSGRFMKACFDRSEVVNVICLGSRQAMLFIDNPVWRKIVILKNPIDFGKFAIRERISDEQSHSIAFLGALKPQKNFHRLADIWIETKKCFPRDLALNLLVIGDSNLYSRITSSSEAMESNLYRDRIHKRLPTNEKSVKFLGILNAEEMSEVLKGVSVGVVNPHGYTEVLSTSALELQARGIPVVSGNRFGMPDVVIHNKTGILVKNQRQLKRALVKLISDSDLNSKMSTNAITFMRREFDFDKVMSSWIVFFQNFNNQQKCINSRDVTLVEILKLKSPRILFRFLNRKVFTHWIECWPSVYEMEESLIRLKSKVGFLVKNVLRN